MVKRLDYDPSRPMRDGETFWWPAAIRGIWTYDNQALFLQIAEYFIEQSVRAANNHAVSYRDFNVGSMLFAVDEPTFRTGTFYGANYKPYPQAPKICAERIAISKAIGRGFSHIAGIVVSGPGHTGEPAEPASELLLPCSDCRAVFEYEPAISEETLLVATNDDGTKSRLLTVGELAASAH